MNTRTKNYTEAEKTFLMNILVPYKPIIENKRTDGVSVKMKKDVWDAVATEYNASLICNARATGNQLSRLWLNIKSKQRGQLTREREQRLANGGGDSDVVIDPQVTAPGVIVQVLSNDSAQKFNADPPSELKSASCSGVSASVSTAATFKVTSDVLTTTLPEISEIYTVTTEDDMDMDGRQPEVIATDEPVSGVSPSATRRRMSSQQSSDVRLSFSQRQTLQTVELKRTCMEYEVRQKEEREDELHELRQNEIKRRQEMESE